LTSGFFPCCEFGKISTLAAATLRSMGYARAVALDGGIRAWREAGYPLEAATRGRGGATPPPSPLCPIFPPGNSWFSGIPSRSPFGRDWRVFGPLSGSIQPGG